MDYIHQVKPWAHQQVAFELSRDREEFALLMEQRTGKSKVLIDTAAWQYAIKGMIDGLLLVAPNGVDDDWAQTYFNEHWPQWAGPQIIAQWNGKLLKKDEAALYEPARATAFHVLCMNIEAFSSSPRARAAAEKFLRMYRAMMAIDESSWIKDPSSERTKHLIKLGRLAKTRRILTGTPSTQSPFDVFAQFKFLNVHLLGFQSFYAFKAHFAEMLPAENGLVRHIIDRNPELKRRGLVPQVVAKDKNERPQYKNLDELQRLMDPHSFRITRRECRDMPESIYATRNVPLSDEQQHFYDRIVDEVFIESEHGELTISNQLSRLLRLQQVTGGFMPSDEEGTTGAPLKHGRIEAVLSEIEQLRGGVVIWARFRNELAAIAESLREAYGAKSVVEYHGGVDSGKRAIAKRAFKLETHDEYPETRFFVGNQASGSYGLELTFADDVFYYSNLYSLEKRIQSEDRPITMTKERHVSYLDFRAGGTVDDKVVHALQNKQAVADALLDSGGLTAWINRGKK